MKVPKEINNLLSNKYVLYVVAFLSLTNIIAYLVAQDYNSLLFFAIIGYLVSYFSKNMTVILLCALIITNLLMTAKSIQNQTIRKIHREGLENMTEKPEGESGMHHPPPHSGKPKKSAKKLCGVDDPDCETEGDDDGSPIKLPETEGMNTQALQGNIAKSMENMSPNKVKEMTQEAGALLESQKQLAENLKTMGPLLNTAKEMMDTLSGSEGMLSKLGMMGGLV